MKISIRLAIHKERPDLLLEHILKWNAIRLTQPEMVSLGFRHSAITERQRAKNRKGVNEWLTE